MGVGKCIYMIYVKDDASLIYINRGEPGDLGLFLFKRLYLGK